MTTVLAKKMVSIRLDEDLIKLLKEVSEKRDSIYFDRGRTWLIEHAVRKVYSPKLNDKEGLPAPASPHSP